MNEHEQGYGVIKDVKQAKEAAKQALQDGLVGWFPAACVVLAKALDDAEKRASPQAEPSDEHVSVVGMPEFDALLDHIYEYGTASEGIIDRANAFARALLARYGQPAAQPKRRPYNASGSLSEYGVFPECDAAIDAAMRKEDKQ